MKPSLILCAVVVIASCAGPSESTSSASKAATLPASMPKTTAKAPAEDRRMLARLESAVYRDPSPRNRFNRTLYRVVPVQLFKVLALPYIALLKALKRR